MSNRRLAYRVMWQTTSMSAPSFWYYKDPERANEVFWRMSRYSDMRNISQESVTVNYDLCPFMDEVDQ